MQSFRARHRFAHLSDVHVGAWREARLAGLSMKAFEWMLDRCIEEGVDFIVISGDLFDSNVPDLQAAREAAEAMRKVKDLGVRIYVTYGSHDYSVSATSNIDVLDGAGLFTKVVRLKPSSEGDTVKLDFVVDGPTGAKLAGLYGRKNGLESEYYAMLDRSSLEREKGFKVFVFHSAIDELRPPGYAYGQSIPLSLFPKGFDYYAGGHVHSTILKEVEGYGFIAFPGPLFGHGFSDLEEIARGTRRGFFLVDFAERVEKVSFVEVPLPKVVYTSVDADGRTPSQVTESLERLAGELESRDAIVLVKVSGRLSSGRTSEVPFDRIRKRLEDGGAIMVRVNRASLTSAERSSARLSGKTKEEIEEGTLRGALSSYSVDPAVEAGLREQIAGQLAAEGGLRTARKLLTSLEQEARENERKEEFRTRMIKEAKEVLGMEGA
jgi:DNA repair exonuclease SbcCD nuclease subunit